MSRLRRWMTGFLAMLGAFGALAAPVALAGTDGQQVVLTAWSPLLGNGSDPGRVQICGENNYNTDRCGPITALPASGPFELHNWWYKGPLTINEWTYSGHEVTGACLDPRDGETPTAVPVSQSSNTFSCYADFGPYAPPLPPANPPVPPPASAAGSASGCTNQLFGSYRKTNSCVTVNGTGLYVFWVQPEVTSGTFQAVDSQTGRFKVWGPGFTRYYPRVTYPISEGSSAAGPRLTLNRYIHPGPICATWLAAAGKTYKQIGNGPACITVHP